MNAIKKMYLKKCLQPGARGLEAIKSMERSYKWFGWLPITGRILRALAPDAEEIQAAMDQQERMKQMNQRRK